MAAFAMEMVLRCCRASRADLQWAPLRVDGCCIGLSFGSTMRFGAAGTDHLTSRPTSQLRPLFSA